MFADSYREPFVKIVEEPAHNLYRFRYGSEGESAGAIPGEKQHYGGKSFPKRRGRLCWKFVVLLRTLRLILISW